MLGIRGRGLRATYGETRDGSFGIAVAARLAFKNDRRLQSVGDANSVEPSWFKLPLRPHPAGRFHLSSCLCFMLDSGWIQLCAPSSERVLAKKRLPLARCHEAVIQPRQRSLRQRLYRPDNMRGEAALRKTRPSIQFRLCLCAIRTLRETPQDSAVAIQTFYSGRIPRDFPCSIAPFQKLTPA